MTPTQRYDLDIPEDTHWELVKLAAELKIIKKTMHKTF